MPLKRHGKSNISNSVVEHPNQTAEYPSREELIGQLSQLRSSLDGAYETLDALAPSADPEVIHKVADMVDIINGLHECEFELMDLLARDSIVMSPTSVRGEEGENTVDNDNARLCEVSAGDENVTRSRAASQEDLSLYGAYAIPSSRSHKTANDISTTEKAYDNLDAIDVQIPARDRADYIKRLEEIQKVNEKLVDRCRRLGLVLRCGFSLDKNFTSKMKEVKDIIAAKEQAQKKILELKVLMQQVAEDKPDTDISLAKIENDESYGRPFRFESRIASMGASSISPEERGPRGEENGIKKPRSFFGAVDSSEGAAPPDYAQFLRGLRQPFVREDGERESAFVPIHNAENHLESLRGKNSRVSNLDSNHIDLNNEVKANLPMSASVRRVMDKESNSSHHEDNWDQRLGRSNSARASLAPPSQPHPSAGTNTLLARVLAAGTNNLYRNSCGKSPPSMQSSSGIGSMNSRSIGSLDNYRNDVPYMPANISRGVNRNHESDDNVGQRGFPNMSSNNLNKSYRQPTRSSSFYSELDFRNQELLGWDEDRVNTTPIPSPPYRDLGFSRRLSASESQQLSEELNRLRRFRTDDEPIPHLQPNWWCSSSELGHAERRPFTTDHQNFLPRGKPTLNEKHHLGNSAFSDDDPMMYDQFSAMPGQTTISDCHSQILQLNVSFQEMSQQIRNLSAVVAASKTATREALMQQRFDLHNMTRGYRDVTEMVSESMKRIEGLVSGQTRLIVNMESRLRTLEDNQRAAAQKYSSSTRERDWQMSGRPDFVISPELFQYSGREAMRDRDNAQSGSMLNNQIPPGTRANNYWDNFRSYSRQNMLSKSNANVPQSFNHEASPSSTENSRYSVSEGLNNTQPQPVSAVPDNSSDGRRNGGGGGAGGGSKNLWATSGFYENMSSKKRNKDQKSQSTSSYTSASGSKTTGSFTTNSSAPEPLRGSHDSQPEPDDTESSSNRQPFHSRHSRSPQMTGLQSLDRDYHRETGPGPFARMSDFELPWPPPVSEMTRKEKFERDLDACHLQISEPSHSRDSHAEIPAPNEDSMPTSKSSAPKGEREKQSHSFETRSSEGLVNLEDTRSSNQESVGNTDDSAMDWATPRHNESSITIEGASSAGEYGSALSSPLQRPHIDNGEVEQNGSNETRESESPSHLTPPTPAVVPFNIRLDENENGTSSSEVSYSRGNYGTLGADQ